ncbi:reverse transcriptase domain-containing protein [Tanacetum coccineum]
MLYSHEAVRHNLLVNPNDKTTIIHDDSEDEADESEKEEEPPSSKINKSDPPPLKAYKPKMPYPQRLRKEKMEERYAKFINLIKEVRINVPLVDVLDGMPNYEEFLKDLINETSLDKEFKEFMAVDVDEILKQEEEIDDNFEELSLEEKLRIKTSIQEPPTDLEMKPLPKHLEYAFLEKDSFLPVVIFTLLKDDEKKHLVSILKNHKEAFAWKTSNIPGISPSFYKHKINFKDDAKPVIQRQRQLNPNMKEVVRKRSSNFSMPIPIEPADLEKTTFTCPYGTYAYKHMPFGLCNAPATFQRCMIAMFQDMLETSMEVFMDEFLVFIDLFNSCLANLEQMLIRCKQAHLVLNWEKCHFMVTEGIMLGHKVSSAGLKVDKAKINVIAKLPPTNVKAFRSFLRHAGFYRRFIKDFSKISHPMTKLLEKDFVFDFNEECIKAFETLKEKLANAPIMVSPDWSHITTRCVAKPLLSPIILLPSIRFPGTIKAEAEALPTNDARVVINFLKKLSSRFGIPKALISDREVKMKDIPFMTPFRHDYRKTMPRVTEKLFIYTVVENTCNEAKLYDLDETGKVTVKGNILYIKEDPSEELPLNEK